MRRIFYWQVAGFLAVSVLGTLLHFLYDWTNQSLAASFVSAVDESTFQHMKLFFVSFWLFTVVEAWFLNGETPYFWGIKLKSVLLGLILIPVLYYTYTGVFGVNADWFNITIFYFSVALSFFVETKSFLQNKKCIISENVAKLGFILLAVVFVIFTFSPPEIPLFEDPTKYRI